jgi:hypothetical protein
LKASEKNVGNRGSKSNSIKFVKEQRADGSYINQKINDLVLRCALREVRKKDLAGIPSNQILNKRLHESFGHPIKEKIYLYIFSPKGSRLSGVRGQQLNIQKIFNLN